MSVVDEAIQEYLEINKTIKELEQKKEEPEISLGGRLMMLKAWKELQAKKHLTMEK